MIYLTQLYEQIKDARQYGDISFKYESILQSDVKGGSYNQEVFDSKVNDICRSSGSKMLKPIMFRKSEIHDLIKFDVGEWNNMKMQVMQPVEHPAFKSVKHSQRSFAILTFWNGYTFITGVVLQITFNQAVTLVLRSKSLRLIDASFLMAVRNNTQAVSDKITENDTPDDSMTLYKPEDVLKFIHSPNRHYHWNLKNNRASVLSPAIEKANGDLGDVVFYTSEIEYQSRTSFRANVTSDNWRILFRKEQVGQNSFTWRIFDIFKLTARSLVALYTSKPQSRLDHPGSRFMPMKALQLAVYDELVSKLATV